MDYILCEQPNCKELVRHCRDILVALEKFNIKAKGSKFTYGRIVNYAGLRLSKEGCLPSVKIVESILDMAEPIKLAICLSLSIDYF